MRFWCHCRTLQNFYTAVPPHAAASSQRAHQGQAIAGARCHTAHARPLVLPTCWQIMVTPKPSNALIRTTVAAASVCATTAASAAASLESSFFHFLGLPDDWAGGKGSSSTANMFLRSTGASVSVEKMHMLNVAQKTDLWIMSGSVEAPVFRALPMAFALQKAWQGMTLCIRPCPLLGLLTCGYARQGQPPVHCPLAARYPPMSCRTPHSFC